MADHIFGPWVALGNFARGTETENETTLRSQSTYVLPVEEKQDTYIFCADRWQPDNLADSPYNWLPIAFEQGNPIIKWIDE